MVSFRTTAAKVPAAIPGEGKDASVAETLGAAPRKSADDLKALLQLPEVQLLLQEQAMTAARATVTQRTRADLVPGVCLVAESELPKYTPWSLAQIRARRKAGTLPAIIDRTTVGKKVTYLYDAYAVLAAIHGTPSGGRSIPRHIPEDLEVEPL